MAANPFLFTEDTFNGSNFAPPASNPFLLENEDSQGRASFNNDNPFISQSAVTATNPFAFDPMDLEPAEAEVPNMDQSQTQNAFLDFDTGQDFFTDVPVTTSINFFTSAESTAQDIFSSPAVTIAQKPTDLNLAYSHQNQNNGAPSRPPPPPRPPPSKETQDLLQSVMGAMDATSSHLLDKIPPTRTPSPVSMRDLHSPSPTPEPAFGELLDVGDSNPIETSTGNISDDLLSLNQGNDINQNPAMAQDPTPLKHIIPPQPIHTVPSLPPNRPLPPVRPPRPAPPQKPPPPKQVVPVPQPPLQMTQPVKTQQDDIMDMLGLEDSAAPPSVKEITTTADIMNLYNVPVKHEIKAQTQPDLLSDNIETDMKPPTPTITEDLVEDEPEVDADVSNSPASQTPETAKESVLSPEHTDLQMDTSDSQSKGSVSSVTFNPFAATDDFNQQVSSPMKQEIIPDVFHAEPSDDVFTQPNKMDIFTTPAPAPTPVPLSMMQDAFDFGTTDPLKTITDDFDDFARKFDSVKTDENKNGTAFEAFSSSNGNTDAWGNDFDSTDATGGFGADDSFDAFLAKNPPAAPQRPPHHLGSQDSDEEKDFSVVIKPKTLDQFSGALPVIAPPPVANQAAYTDTSPRFNPFDQQTDTNDGIVTQDQAIPYGVEMKRTDSQETPPTPLFDEDVSQPLEPFPRIDISGEDGWEMHLRQPNKKKITGQRFWKKIFVKISHQPDCVLLQLFNQQSDKDPFQELPLQPCYSVSEIGAQQYDQFGKIFTVKLQYIFYKERPGVRPGQVKKAERITNKLSQFAAYAIQGDYQGVKEFGSDLKKLGLPVEHAPQVSQLMKLGSLNYEELKQFSVSIEEALFKLQAHRDRALHYKMEEVQITAVDELYVEQTADGHIEKQIARVRLFFLGFLTGMPDIELGINDMRRQGREVVGRHDIIPVVTEEWIRLEAVEFHSSVQQDEYENTHIIKFKPPDACYIELLRFRVRPPKNRELPLQLKAQICVTGTRIELKADVLVPGFTSRKLGQIPCEDVMIRFPIPECWIYMFRVEKHFRYGSVKSAHRRTGKIKGIERILGTVDAPQESLIEVTSGQAKYEHQHRAIVWRCPRLPKEGQGAYTTHNMVCRIALTSYDQMPEKLAEYCYVEFTMPATQVSHTTCRSVSLQNSDSDEPPEKYVRYLARHEYRVGIEHTEGDNPNPYASATYVSKPAAPVVQEKPAAVAEESSSDSD